MAQSADDDMKPGPSGVTPVGVMENGETDETTSVFDPARFKVLAICVVAAMGGLLSGLDVGVISGALKFIAQTFHASTVAQEWIVSAMMAGAAIGSISAGWLSHHLGRKRSLFIGAGAFAIGAIGSALSWSIPSLICFRGVMGFAIGLAAFTAPLYLSELATEDTRGAMVSMYQLMVTIGIFVAFLSDTFLSYSGNWRWMFGAVSIPAILFLIGLLFLPHSPRWLMLHGRNKEAREILLDLREDPMEAAQEIKAIKAQLQTKQEGWKLFRTNSNYRRSIVLGMLLQIMQQLAGINIVMYYAPEILQKAHFDTQGQMWCTAIIGLVNMLATFVALGLVDRWGRKPILYTGFTVMAVGMGLLGWLLHGGMNTEASQMAAVFLLIVFCAGFAMSVGPLAWLICSEIQPASGRDFGVAVSTFTNWTANLIVGVSFLSLMQALGVADTFWLFASLNVLFLVLTFLFVPETKGVSLAKLQSRLMRGVRLRDIGRT